MRIEESARGAEFLALVEARLPKKLARHCIAVAEMMLSIANETRLNADDAVAAGLLHDLCKPLNPEELIARAEAYGLPINEAARAKPMLLHGPIAAEEVRRELGVTSQDVYDAIAWHTTGRPGLAPLGLALYVTDFSEPHRTHPTSEEARARLRRDGFQAALRFVSRSKLEHVRTKAHMDPMTEVFHAWIEERMG